MIYLSITPWIFPIHSQTSTIFHRLHNKSKNNLRLNKDASICLNNYPQISIIRQYTTIKLLLLISISNLVSLLYVLFSKHNCMMKVPTLDNNKWRIVILWNKVEVLIWFRMSFIRIVCWWDIQRIVVRKCRSKGRQDVGWQKIKMKIKSWPNKINK